MGYIYKSYKLCMSLFDDSSKHHSLATQQNTETCAVIIKFRHLNRLPTFSHIKVRAGPIFFNFVGRCIIQYGVCLLLPQALQIQRRGWRRLL